MQTSKPHVLAVVGAQYGSEGKGSIVNKIADKYQVHVRTGGPNAGHTIWHKGNKFVMQTIPCGWVNPHSTLIIGRGGLIHIPTLRQELKFLRDYGIDLVNRLCIDAKTGILEDSHHEKEGGVEGLLHQQIGSTGEGVGVARVAKIARNVMEFRNFEDAASQYYDLKPYLVYNTPLILSHELIMKNKNILLEGTQGSGLSMTHGTWPYVTSSDTNAAQLAADTGIPPQYVKTLLVARTFPIRVAGNSGPLENEISWEQLSGELGKPVIEKTTVTKKVRRIGRWDMDTVLDSIIINKPSSIALNFIDYISPEDEGIEFYDKLSNKSRDFIQFVEHNTGVKVSLIGTGGPNCTVIQKGEI